MNKLEFELEKLRVVAAADRLQKIVDFLSTGLILGAVVTCCSIIFNALVQMTAANADTISAIAKVVEALHLSEITSYMVGLSGCGYGYYERRGKKKAVERLDKLQKQVEGNDPFRGSSNLTPRGDTPRQRGQ